MRREDGLRRGVNGKEAHACLRASTMSRRMIPQATLIDRCIIEGAKSEESLFQLPAAEKEIRERGKPRAKMVAACGSFNLVAHRANLCDTTGNRE